MPVRASFQPSGPAWCWGPTAAVGPEMEWRARLSSERSRTLFSLGTLGGAPAVNPLYEYYQRLTSDQVGIPAELKHINKRRKRNQQGLP
jgi:hypothetical protein